MFCIDFIAGGIAGATSRTCVSPFERLKIIFQVNNDTRVAFFYFSQLQDGKNLGISGTLKNIWKTEGFAGMFKGEIYFN